MLHAQRLPLCGHRSFAIQGRPSLHLTRAQRRPCVSVSAAMPAIMVNSCTGKMGNAVAAALLNEGFELVPYTFTGFSAAVAVANIGVSGIPVEIVGAERRQAVMDDVKLQYPSLMIVDFTLPNCVNDNARFYAANGVPFVMGTSGGDREQLEADILKAGTYAVIGTQMGAQINAFTASLQKLADQFPGCFFGYDLEIIESHQSTKVDTSGTARDLLKAFQAMGVKCSEKDIKKVRDEERQLKIIGVPESALGAHAFHTYRLTSRDRTVQFVMKHNVTGRDMYVKGTVSALRYLIKMMEKEDEKKLYRMVDVVADE